MSDPQTITSLAKGRKCSKLLGNPEAFFGFIRWVARIGGAVSLAMLSWLTIRYLLSEEAAHLAPRLNLLSGLATLVLVVITAKYVHITAKTLEHLREERLTVAEPLLYLKLKTVRFDPDNILTLSLENFGKGPALRVIGEYQSRSRSTGGEILRSDINALADVVVVGDISTISLHLPPDVTDLLPTKGREDGFLLIRLVYEDARRNLYVYRLSLTLIAFDGRQYVQENSERVWRIPPHERYYIFDNSKTIVEYGRKPMFSRDLGLPRGPVDL